MKIVYLDANNRQVEVDKVKAIVICDILNRPIWVAADIWSNNVDAEQIAFADSRSAEFVGILQYSGIKIDVPHYPILSLEKDLETPEQRLEVQHLQFPS